MELKNPLRNSRAREPDERRLARAAELKLAVAEALGLDAVIGAQKLQESRGIVGADDAADAQISERWGGESEANVAVAVEEFDGFAQRRVVKLEAGNAPRELLGELRRGHFHDGGGRSVRHKIGGYNGDAGAFRDEGERLHRSGEGIGGGAVDGDPTVGDENIDVTRGEAHGEGGADGAHRNLARDDDEGAGGVVGDFEVSLTAHDGDATDGGRKFDAHLRIAVELDLRTIGEELARGPRERGAGGE
jgi:hypothetical protein